MDERQHTLAQQLAGAGRQLERAGLVAWRAGNLSARHTDGSIVTTPSGARKGSLPPAALVWLNAQGAALHPHAARPSSEIKIHLAIYDACPEARAVVHAHPIQATALGLLPAPLRLAITAEAAATLGPVARVPYLRPGAQPLADAIGRAAPRARVILMRQHGAVTWGASLDEALGLMEALEHVASIWLATARVMHPPPTLADDEVHALRHHAGVLAGPAEVIEIDA